MTTSYDYLQKIKKIQNIIIIIIILLVIGLVIGLVFLIKFLIKERFTTTIPASTQSSTTTIPMITCPQIVKEFKSITNLNSGYIIDIESTGAPDNSYFLIHYDVESKTTPAGVYAVDDKNNLVIQVKNQSGLKQKWYMKKLDENNFCVSTNPIFCDGPIDCKSKELNVLTFENTMSGFVLSNRPFNDFDTQKWNPSGDITSPYGRSGISLSSIQPNSLSSITGNVMPSGMISDNSMLDSLHLNDANENKLRSVLDLISTNLQIYRENAGRDGNIAASQLGSSVNTPLKVNLSLTGNTALLSSMNNKNQNNKIKEKFNTIQNSNVVDLLNKYELNENPDISDSVYTLDKAMSSVVSCPILDSKDYALNRVGQCNCDLSALSGI